MNMKERLRLWWQKLPPRSQRIVQIATISIVAAGMILAAIF